jgi:hypothetical protein
VSATVSSPSISLNLLRGSNLVPIGAKVMVWERDYRQLAELIYAVGERFTVVTGKTRYRLDLEYKKTSPTGALVIKQVREVPRSDAAATTTPFLLHDPTEYCIHQGEVWPREGSVFATHRLKLQWHLGTKSLWLTPANLGQGFYENTLLHYTADGRIRVLSGSPSLWPDASHTTESQLNATTLIDRWRLPHLLNPRTYELRTQNVPQQVPRANPLVTLRDFDAGFLQLRVAYARPVVSFDEHDRLTSTTTDQVTLWPSPRPQVGDLFQVRSFHDAQQGTSISTAFYWPPDPGLAAGYTAPLARWVETTIEGPASERIVLRGYYSQTYGPAHHNFSEHFLFEPQLEPGISPAVLRELRAKNVCVIHYYNDFGGQSYIRTYGCDAMASAATAAWRRYQ